MNNVPTDIKDALANDQEGRLAVELLDRMIGQSRLSAWADLDVFNQGYQKGLAHSGVAEIQQELDDAGAMMKLQNSLIEALSAEITDSHSEAESLYRVISNWETRDAMQRLMAEELAISLSIFARSLTRATELLEPGSKYDPAKRNFIESARKVAGTYEARRLSVLDLLNKLYGEPPVATEDYQALEKVLNG